MPESADVAGTAFNARAVAGPREELDELYKLQLADLEARELVERMEEKVAKFEAHLESVKECLADAERAAAEAREALDNHGSSEAEDEAEEPDQ
jgi:hypothetical protein